MGLDMYLYAVPRIEGMNYEEILEASSNLSQIEKENPGQYEILKPHIIEYEEFGEKYRGLTKQLAYWRKANQIHNWFVVNVQNGEDDCQTHEVSKIHLQRLYHLCCEILLRGKAEKILPTKPGFFFGSTDYDHYYYVEIEQTKKILSEILELYDFNAYFFIYNSLW